nr:MAG TPA: hypothetical protein [Caudoviricetes sp.]
MRNKYNPYFLKSQYVKRNFFIFLIKKYCISRKI